MSEENFVIYFDKFVFIKNETGIYIGDLKYRSFGNYFKRMFYEFDESGLGCDFDFIITKRCQKKVDFLQKFIDSVGELKKMKLEPQTIEGKIDDFDDIFSGNMANYKSKEDSI